MLEPDGDGPLDQRALAGDDLLVRRVDREPRRTVDLGEVNGTIFVNNSSLGLYPHIVRSREQQQERLGRSKWVALA